VGEVLKKFFFQYYQSSRNYYFRPSCLISCPLNASSHEVVNDKSRLYNLNFTEEEAKVWLEVLKIRYEEREEKDIRKLIQEYLELDKVPVFKRVLNSINEPTEPLFQKKPQEKADNKAKVVPIDKAVKQSKTENTKPTSKTDKRKEPETTEIKAEFNSKVILHADENRRFTSFTEKILKANILKNKTTETPYPNGKDKSEPNDDVWRDVIDRF
jgi:hypothetical protein